MAPFISLLVLFLFYFSFFYFTIFSLFLFGALAFHAFPVYLRPTYVSYFCVKDKHLFIFYFNFSSSLRLWLSFDIASGTM